MKEELLNVKGATETVLLYRLELLAPCPMPSHPIRKASLFLGGREKRLGRNRPPQNGVIGGSVAL